MPKLHGPSKTPEGSDCVQEHNTEWRYCPACGSILTRLEFPLETRVAVDGTSATAVEIPFQRLGDSPLEIEVDESSDSRIEIDSPRWSGARGSVRIHVPSGSVGTEGSYDVVFRVDDGPRDQKEPFRTRVRRTLFARLVVSRGRARAALLPAYLPLGRALAARDFRVLNEGSTVLDVDRVEADNGFAIEPPADARNFRLAPSESRTLTVRRVVDTARGATVRAVGRGDEVLAEARVDWVPPGRTTAPPYAYVIGIDFGTSNTSVYARDVRVRSNPPVPLPNAEERRFETLIYVKGREAEWVIGNKALDLYDRDPEGRQFLIRGLKTLVREEPDASKRILKVYLERILRTYVEPYLRTVNPGDRLPVCFVFSLPVLDKAGSGEDFLRYQTVVLDAAERAGFVDRDRGWAVDTILEPDAAALEILLSDPGSVAFGDGDRILVVDSGGGTTDLTLATLTIESGEVGLRDIRNGSVTTPGSGDEDARQFGGNRIDDEILRILTEPPSALRQDWRTDERNRDLPEPAVEAEFRKAMLRLLEEQKRRIADDGEEVRPLYENPVAKRSHSLSAAQVRQAFETFGPAVMASIDEFLEHEGVAARELKKVFAVGGNNRLDVLHQMLSEHFGRDKVANLSGDRRSMAVPRGIVYRFSNRVQTVSADVEVTDATGRTLIQLSGRGIGTPERTQLLPVGAGERTHVDVWAVPDGGDRMLVDRLTVVCDDEDSQAEITAAIRDGSLTVDVSGSHVRPASLTYRLEPTR